MLRAVKYRLYPTREQEALFMRYFSACRYVYNIALEVKIYAYRAHGVTVSEYDLVKQLQEAKKANEWLREFSAQTLNYEMTCLDLAYKAFFKTKKGFPKFKSRFDRQSCTFLQNSFVPDDKHIDLPKVGLVKASIHRRLEGTVKRITVSRSASGKFYGSAIVEMEDTTYQLPANNKAVGVDMGIRNLVNLHDNEQGSKIAITGLIEAGKSESMKIRLDHLQAKIKRVQRHLSRKTEHRKKDKQGRSKRQEKCRIRLARLKEQEAEIRGYFLHNLSAKLTNEYSTVCIEDLAVKNMSRSAKGTAEDPGKNVKAKAGLNREIVRSGMGALRIMLEYKAKQKGRKVVVVDRWLASSKNCSNCGTKNTELKSKRKWTCSNCGTDHDRDDNAAKNILAAGIDKAASDVYAEYTHGAEKKSRNKKTAKKVSVELSTPNNSSSKKRRKPRVVTISQECGVTDG